MTGQATDFLTYLSKGHPELAKLMSIYSSLTMLVSSSLIRFIFKIIEYFSVFQKIKKMQDFVKKNLDICDLFDEAHLRSEARQLRRLMHPDVTNLVTLMSKWDARRNPKGRVVACQIILLLICSCLTSLFVFWRIQHGSFKEITSLLGVLVLVSWAVGFFVGFTLVCNAAKKYPGRPIGIIELCFAIVSAFLGGVAGLSLLVFFYSIWKII